MREKSWIRQILQGDRNAGENLVEQHYTRIFRLLLYLTGNPETAEDLTQQTFVKAWQGLPAFRREAKISTWLHRIAYHEYTHWLRARRDHAPLEEAAHLPAPSAAPLGQWDEELPVALAKLPEEQRNAFLLFYVQELSVGEVAAILEVPKGTVKSRLHVARQRLRELLHDSLFNTREPSRLEPAVVEGGLCK